MTERELADIRALHTATTQGTWTHNGVHSIWLKEDPDVEDVYIASTDSKIHHHWLPPAEEKLANAKFIAAAHQAIPTLLDEIDTLKGILSDMQTESNTYHLGVAEGRKQMLDAAKAHVNGKHLWTVLDSFIEKMENIT